MSGASQPAQVGSSEQAGASASARSDGAARACGAPRRPVWAHEPRARRVGLTREAIVEAAVRLADAEGLEAVSIRRVAGELKARAMSLYTHIPSKDDLLDLMVDEVVGEVVVRGELPGDWREAITVITRQERAVVQRHPWIVELIGGSQGWFGPNALRHFEQSLAAVSRLDVDPGTAMRIIRAVDGYAYGTMHRGVIGRASGTPWQAGLSEDDRAAFQRPYVQRLLAGGDFPYLVRLLGDRADEPDDAGTPGGAEEDFEQGLTWLLDGIERDLLGSGG